MNYNKIATDRKENDAPLVISPRPLDFFLN